MRYSDQKMYNLYLKENTEGTPAPKIDQKSFSPTNLINQLRNILRNRPAILVKTLIQVYKMPGGAKMITAIKSALRLKR